MKGDRNEKIEIVPLYYTVNGRLTVENGKLNYIEPCFRYPYPADTFLVFKALYPELFLVAIKNDEIVGYVCGVLRRDGCGHIVSICVRPKFRGLGIGKALMLEIEKRFIELGVKCFLLEVGVGNEIAQRLYMKLGYRVIGRIKNYYPDGEDAFVMRKDI